MVNTAIGLFAVEDSHVANILSHKLKSTKKLCQPPRKYSDIYAAMKCWLNAPEITTEEAAHRQELFQLRLSMLEKIDEEHYIHKYIKLRT